MLSRVAKRVRRRSVQPPVLQHDGEPCIEAREEMVPVQNPPDLVRWTNILEIPFPRVAMGGYARYYASSSTSTSSLKFAPSPPFCPILSQFPEASPSTQVPSTSPLFSSSSSAVKQQRLTVIHEVSTESIAFTHPHPRAVSISICTTNINTNTTGGPGPGSASLRRKRRQLLRTPSIERDFAVISRHLLLSPSSSNNGSEDNETSSMEVPVSHGGSGSAHSYAYSNSTDSHSSQSGGEHSSEYPDPATPETSVEGAEDGDVFRVVRRLEEEGEKGKGTEHEAGVDTWKDTLKLPEPPKRPGSGTSFSTAMSEFDDVLVLPDDIDQQGQTPLKDRI